MMPVNERYSLVETMAPQQPVEVELTDRSGRGLYASTVVALTPTHLAISPPVRGTETLSLGVGTTVRITYQREVSKYAFETVVRAVSSESIVVGAPTRVEIASRRAERIELDNAPVTIVRLDHGGEEVQGTVEDVSAWGMRVILPSGLTQWEQVRAIVILSDGPFAAEGQIVRVEVQTPSTAAHGLYLPNLTANELTRLSRLGG